MGLDALKDKWQNLSKNQKIIIIALGVFSLVAFISLGQWLAKDEFVPLMTDLNVRDASAIREKLTELNIPFELGAEGSSILVPRSQVYDVRLQLASEGVLDGGGLGFELFDQTKLGVTDFERRLNYQRALQEEIRRTIVQLDEVEEARVHIVLPEKNVFIEEEKEATASIALKLKPLTQLKPEQVKGVIQLVSSSVEGLPPERVNIIDMNGNILSEDVLSETDSPSKRTLSQHELQRTFEKDMEKRVQNMLEKILGPGKAVAMVSAELDFDHQENTVINYDDNGVVRSEQILEESSKTTGEGVPPVGTGSNNNPDTYPVLNPGESESNRTEQTKNYEISETKNHTVKAPGAIKRLSTAVTVDGALDADLQTEVEGLVAAATGYNPNRGDQIVVSSIAFDTSYMDKVNEEMERAAQQEAERLQQITYIKYGVAALVSLIIFVGLFMVLRAQRKKLGNQLDLVIDEPIPLMELEMEPVAKVVPDENSEGNKKIKKIAKEEPGEVASLIKVWLAEDRG